MAMLFILLSESASRRVHKGSQRLYSLWLQMMSFKKNKNHTNSVFSSSPAFTIVELLIVIVVIAVLSAVSLVVYNGFTQNARDKTLISDAAGVEAEVVRFASKNNGVYGSALQWYSAGSPNSNVQFTPSSGNIIDIVANDASYCIRVYNPVSNRNSITNAYTKGADPQSCLLLDASVAAGGTGGTVVGWWKLNGNTLDSTSYGNNGILGGTPGPTLTAGQNGQPDGAYKFSDTINQWINTGYNFPLNILTVSVWAKPTGNSPQSYGAIVSNTRDCCATYNGFQIHYTKASSTINTRLWYGSGSSSNLTSPTALPTNVWHHIVLTYDGQTSRLYLNGQLVSSAALIQTLGSSAYNVSIGKGGWSSSNYSFGGDIDDVRIYNYALSASVVSDLYSAGAQ